MSDSDQPFVSVLTPVYNMGEFLAKCIESVLSQTYRNFEYIIVNNCSTDQTLEVAQKYAKKDSRIRIHNNDRFVGVIENHNIAFGLIAPEAKYCKIVSADDFLYPECISRMVSCGEANPDVGIVGSYQLSGSYVKWQGFSYPQTVFDGPELCRRMFYLQQEFLGDEPLLGFGTPTSMLYRADLIRNAKGGFFPNDSPHADTSACFEQLRHSSFGFVYQVLSCERTHPGTQTSTSVKMNRHASAALNDLVQYGPFYLGAEELKERVNSQVHAYYRFLAVEYIVGFRSKEFWEYHTRRLQELGYPLTRFKLLKCAMAAVLHELANPGTAIQKLRKRAFRKRVNCPASLGQASSGPPMPSGTVREETTVARHMRGIRTSGIPPANMSPAAGLLRRPDGSS